VNLSVSATSGTLLPYVRISRPTGALQFENWGAATFGYAFVVPATGTYTVAVADTGGPNTGAYSIVATGVDTGPTPPPELPPVSAPVPPWATTFLALALGGLGLGLSHRGRGPRVD
jgi:hypothetical protein